MHLDAAQNVALPIGRLVGDRDLPLAEAAVDIGIARRVKCMMPSVRPAVARRKYLFSREKTDRFIAVIVTSPSVLLAPTTEDRTGGSLHDRNHSASR